MIDLELEDLRAFGDRPIVTLELTGLQALCLLGTIQLACRHPGNTGPTRRIVETWARAELQPAVSLTPALTRIAEMGWDPECDEPADTGTPT